MLLLAHVLRIGGLVPGAFPLARAFVLGPGAGVLVDAARFRFDFDDPADRTVEEGAVVRDEHDAGRQVAQESFEPVEAGEIEVVRRLVEQEDVEAGEQDRGQSDPRRFASRERCEFTVRASSEADVVEHRADARFEVFAAKGEKAIERVGVGAGEFRLGAEAGGEAVHLLLGPADARAPRQVVAHALARRRLGLLREVADGAAPYDPARIRLLESGEHPQQSRLADAVRADDPDPVPRRDDDRDVVEHLDGGEALDEVACSE